MTVVIEQLYVLIGYTNRGSNICKDVKRNLLKLRKTDALTKDEHGLLAEQ